MDSVTQPPSSVIHLLSAHLLYTVIWNLLLKNGFKILSHLFYSQSVYKNNAHTFLLTGSTKTIVICLYVLLDQKPKQSYAYTMYRVIHEETKIPWKVIEKVILKQKLYMYFFSIP